MVEKGAVGKLLRREQELVTFYFAKRLLHGPVHAGAFYCSPPFAIYSLDYPVIKCAGK
jgi:hypothetical protein